MSTCAICSNNLLFADECGVCWRCDDCGKKYPCSVAPVDFSGDARRFCAACVTVCASCEEPTILSRSHKNPDGKVVCQECFDEDYGVCEDCQGTFPQADLDDGYCRDCWGDHYFRCEACGETDGSDNAYSGDVIEGTYCHDCYCERVGRCEACDAEFNIRHDEWHEDAESGNSYCGDCWDHDANQPTSTHGRVSSRTPRLRVEAAAADLSAPLHEVMRSASVAFEGPETLIPQGDFVTFESADFACDAIAAAVGPIRNGQGVRLHGVKDEHGDALWISLDLMREEAFRDFVGADFVVTEGTLDAPFGRVKFQRDATRLIGISRRLREEWAADGTKGTVHDLIEFLKRLYGVALAAAIEETSERREDLCAEYRAAA